MEKKKIDSLFYWLYAFTVLFLFTCKNAFFILIPSSSPADKPYRPDTESLDGKRQQQSSPI